MAKLSDNSRSLLRENYPLRMVARALYSDMDAFRHLNNGAAGRYFEEGRAELNGRVFGPECMVNPPNGFQMLLATIQIDYLRQAHYPGEVEIATGLARVGSSSFIVAQGAFQRGVCFALAQAVTIKAIDGVPVALTEQERAAMAELTLPR